MFTSLKNPTQIDTILEPRPLQLLHMRRRCSATSHGYSRIRKFQRDFIFSTFIVQKKKDVLELPRYFTRVL